MSDVHSTDDHPTGDHGADPEAGDHAAAQNHGAGHGAGHGHLDEPLGPIDVVAWGVGILGVAVGLLTAYCFALTTGLLVV